MRSTTNTDSSCDCDLARPKISLQLRQLEGVYQSEAVEGTKSVPTKKDDDLIQMKHRLATCEPVDLKGHLKPHIKCTEEQIDDFLTRYNADIDDESGDDDEEECDEIGQREEV